MVNSIQELCWINKAAMGKETISLPAIIPNSIQFQPSPCQTFCSRERSAPSIRMSYQYKIHFTFRIVIGLIFLTEMRYTEQSYFHLPSQWPF